MTNSERGYIESIAASLRASKFLRKNSNLVISTNTKSIEYGIYISDLAKKYDIDAKIWPSCSADKHANLIYQFCPTDLCMLLHDDDEVNKGNFEDFLKCVFDHPGYGSYSSNDQILVNNEIKENNIHKETQIKLNCFHVAAAYLVNRHFVCFPTIIYNKPNLKIEFFHNKFGKYTDAYIVICLIRQRHLFYGVPAIKYRIHSGQDSYEKNYRKIILKLYLIFIFTLNIKNCSFKNIKSVYDRVRYKFVK